jgi:nitrite reductase (NO-forming)
VPPDASAAITGRVRIVQDQARRALRLSFLFVIAAAAAVVVPHRSGAWLPLHLFLVGGLGLAISGATRLFAVTWSAGEPSHPRLVVAQRWMMAIGAAGLAAGRELDAPTAALAAAGVWVSGGMALLGFLLVKDVRHARVRRFHAAVRYYLAAIAAGLVGTGLGAAMVAGDPLLRNAHVTVNLLGFVGLVIAGTLPSFTATSARMKMSRRASSRRLNRNLVWLATAIVVATIGAIVDSDRVEAAGLVAYAAGLLDLATLLPAPRRKQFAWAGPRLVQLGAGFAWWIGTVVVAAVNAVNGVPALPEKFVVALVIGGYLQILIASLAYLAPVLRGGGHVRLTAAFATTRSWFALVAANVAGFAWLAGLRTVTTVAVVLLAIDVGARASRLARPGAAEQVVVAPSREGAAA